MCDMCDIHARSAVDPAQTPRCNTLQHPTRQCNSLRHSATHCDTLYHFYHTSILTEMWILCSHCNALHTATHCNKPQFLSSLPVARRNTLQQTATHCTTLRHTVKQQHIATHCNTLQHTATHGNSLPAASQVMHCNTLQHTTTHCNTLQHTATHCNTLQRRGSCAV